MPSKTFAPGAGIVTTRMPAESTPYRKIAERNGNARSKESMTARVARALSHGIACTKPPARSAPESRRSLGEHAAPATRATETILRMRMVVDRANSLVVGLTNCGQAAPRDAGASIDAAELHWKAQLNNAPGVRRQLQPPG
jgi:hypothetical protein